MGSRGRVRGSDVLPLGKGSFSGLVFQTPWMNVPSSSSSKQVRYRYRCEDLEIRERWKENKEMTKRHVACTREHRKRPQRRSTAAEISRVDIGTNFFLCPCVGVIVFSNKSNCFFCEKIKSN